MKNFHCITTVFLLVLVAVPSLGAQPTEFRHLPVQEYRDKMKAGWVGQMAGVSWGGPTEFKWLDKIIPENAMPKWRPEMINDAFEQDDLYVEMTFLRTLEKYGLGATAKQAGIDFANSEYQLWCANLVGRNNLRSGIAPPDSGHPRFSKRSNDIDYQIESDYSGLISPGMPNAAIALGEKFGRMMNYSDGLYAGQFMGGMYCEAFFENDIQKVIEAGLACIPTKSQYAEMVRDLIAWYQENPNDWMATWNRCLKKYRQNPEYQKCSNGYIDVKINGAYVLMGLLYGKGDPERTIVIATRCGLDSDCNPSSAGGVLCATIGYSQLPVEFTEKLDETKIFSHTTYNFPRLLDVCEKLARQVLESQGGHIEKNDRGEEIFVIPVKKAVPGQLELSWNPGPIAGSRFTLEEMNQIKIKVEPIEKQAEKRFPGWKIAQCGSDMNPGILETYRGKKQVLLTHPLSKDVPCVLSKTVDVPTHQKTTLKVVVSHFVHEKTAGDWDLILRINGSIQKKWLISKDTVGPDGWVEIDFDLTPFAGATGLQIDLENAANGWSYEAGYWAAITIESQ